MQAVAHLPLLEPPHALGCSQFVTALVKAGLGRPVYRGEAEGKSCALLAGTAAAIVRNCQGIGLLNELSRFKSDLIALLPRLTRFARTLTRSQTDADDLVQETCIKALARHHQWDPSQSLDGWVFRIARNHWFDELRKRQIRTGSGQVDASETTELVTEHAAEDQMAVSELMGKVSSLPGELSSLLLLVCAEGYSYKEAADLMGIPIGTVMSRVHRARKILSAGLQNREQSIS